LKASIIITTYKRNEFLLRAILSSINQNYTDFETIVVDDNGRNSDFQKNNAILLEQYISDNSIKYVVMGKNEGACNARNEGALYAQGEYLFFLDDDDEFLPNKLAVQIDFLGKNFVYAAHLSSMIRINYDGTEINSVENIPRGDNFVSFATDGNFFTPMMAIRENIFWDLGGFDKVDRFQDQYFMNKLLVKGYQIKMDSLPLYVMHEHSEKRITNISLAKSLTSLNILLNFKQNYKARFTLDQWKKVEINHLKMEASIYFSSDKYVDHLKASLIYLNIFLKKPSKTMFHSIFRSMIPM
jgi:glycosyltransferase involved in cell wall biosynthesis